MSIFTSRFSNRTSSSSASESWEEGNTNEDPLDLGKDSQPATAPSNWLIVMGPPSSGKSTLVRQLKLAHDGIDVSESIRYVRETHKIALGIFKHVAREALPKLPDDLKKVADRVLALKRRATISSNVAEDIKLLWSDAEVRQIEENLADVQMRKACQHYYSRVEALADDEYVPETLDLLHMAVPTVGQQDTCISNFPGGQLSIFELTNEIKLSSNKTGSRRPSVTVSKGQAHHDLFGPGLRGIIFVTSLIEYEDASRVSCSSKNAQRSSTTGLSFLPSFGESKETDAESMFSPRADTLKMWRDAQSSASACGVPCFLILSKRDLLDEQLKLSNNVSAFVVEAILRSRYVATKATSPPTFASSGEAPASPPVSTPSEGARKVPALEPSTSLAPDADVHAQSTDLLDSEQALDSLVKLLMQRAFPELEVDEDEVTALGDAVHVCLTHFCTADSTLLSTLGAIPVSKWQNRTLNIADHTWLHELPKPIPNPKLVSSEMALRMGKDSPSETRQLFWAAMCSLAEQLGNYVPKTLGFLHIRPLLTSSGALLVVFRQDIDAQTLVSEASSFKSRKLRWLPISQVAAKLARVAQGAELCNYSREAELRSYASDVRQMLMETPSRELMPFVWLDKLKLACSEKAMNTKPGPGTYVLSFITRSTADGLRILIPADSSTMPPMVKISDGYLTSDDWSTLCEIGRAAKMGESSPKVPKAWSAAKGWMGPEVGTEKQFNMIQKFFYGVISLRQRLELKCSAMKDELRYSRVGGAVQSLEALGELYTSEIVLADGGGKVQLLIVSRHHDASEPELYPKGIRWQPFNIFEAEHLAHLLPELCGAVCTAKELLHMGLAIQSNLNCMTLQSTPGAGLRGSAALRSSGASSFDGKASFDNSLRDSSTNEGNVDLCAANDQVEVKIIEPKDDQSLQDAWDRMRWTKRVMRSVCADRLDDFGFQSTPATQLHTTNTKPPKQRAEAHVRAYQESLEAVQTTVKQLSDKLEQLRLTESERAK